MSSLHAVSLRRACSFAAALALVACSADTSGGPLAPAAPALSAARVALPFKGTLEANQTSVVPLGPTTILASSRGTGTATQMGRYSLVSESTIDLATLAGTEVLTYTAANGDMLFVTVSAQATPNADGTLSVVESATINGGTGRFTGATGSFTENCVVDQATGVSIGSFDGTITLDR